MCDDQNFNDLPDYLKDVPLEGINPDELDALGLYLNVNAPESHASSDNLLSDQSAASSSQVNLETPVIGHSKKEFAKKSSDASGGMQLCQVCSVPVQKFSYQGKIVCKACYVFFKGIISNNEVNSCLAENGECKIEQQERKNRCKFCRFWKCISLGLRNHYPTNGSVDDNMQMSNSDTELSQDNNQAKISIVGLVKSSASKNYNNSVCSKPIDRERKSLKHSDTSERLPTIQEEDTIETITLGDSPDGSESNQESETFSRLLVDRKDELEKANQVNASTPQSTAINTPIVDKYGLPHDINHKFSQWLYGDLKLFDPGSSAKKRIEDERSPAQKIRRKRKRRRLIFLQQQEAERQQAQSRFQQRDECIIIDNKHDLVGHDLKFLTQDLEVDKLEPETEILTPFLKVRHSLLDLADDGIAAPRVEQPIQSTSNPGNRHRTEKHKLTLTLETKRTIIDRKPMLRKIKTLNMNRTDGFTEVSSTALIAPGEDCDDSDDYEYIEIDCDSIY